MITWLFICLAALPSVCEGQEILGYYPDGSATCEARETSTAFDDEIASWVEGERCDDVPEQCWADGQDTE